MGTLWNKYGEKIGTTTGSDKTDYSSTASNTTVGGGATAGYKGDDYKNKNKNSKVQTTPPKLDTSVLTGYAKDYAVGINDGFNDDDSHFYANFMNGGTTLSKDYIANLIGTGLFNVEGLENSFDENGMFKSSYAVDNPFTNAYNEWLAQQALIEEEVSLLEEGVVDEQIPVGTGTKPVYSMGTLTDNPVNLNNRSDPNNISTTKNKGGASIQGDRYMNAINRKLAQDMWKDRM